MKRISIALFIAMSLLEIRASSAACPLAPTPFITAVEFDQAGKPTAAVFGYENQTNNTITLSAGGPCNFFLPTNFRPGLISDFLPGLHERAFRVKVNPTETLLLWIVGDNSTFTELVQGPVASPANPIPSLPPATVSVPYVQRLAAIGGSGTLTWSVLAPPSSFGKAALPPGLSLSTDGVLSGTPTVAGQFVIKATATDGATTAGKSFALNVGSGLAISDDLSTRSPGFSPQFRIVSNAGSTINATATCNANEFVITGGGQCSVPNNNAVLGRIASSTPTANGWAITCSGGTATGIAVCSLK
jgi:Putative Ig domain